MKVFFVFVFLQVKKIKCSLVYINTHIHIHVYTHTLVYTDKHAHTFSFRPCRLLAKREHWLNELSNGEIPWHPRSRRISILQHAILPVHSAPTQPSSPVTGSPKGFDCSRCGSVCWKINAECLLLFFLLFFSFTLIRAAHNSVLHYHFGKEPLEAGNSCNCCKAPRAINSSSSKYLSSEMGNAEGRVLEGCASELFRTPLFFKTFFTVSGCIADIF